MQDVYNGLGQLTGEYQSHSGAVNIGTTPEVQYAYTEMAGGAEQQPADQHDLSQRLCPRLQLRHRAWTAPSAG